MLSSYCAQLEYYKQLRTNIHQFIFLLINPKSLKFMPGQYILLNINEGYRQYSVASSPSDDSHIELIVDTTPMGKGSKFLLNLKKGDKIFFRAPLGIFTLQINQLPKIFLATGTGIAPIKSMILSLYEQGFSQSYKLLWGMRSSSQSYYEDIWQNIAQKTRYFSYTYCLSKPKKDTDNLPKHCKHGRIPDILKKSLQNNIFEKTEWYICGRPVIVDSLKKFLGQKLNIPDSLIFHEKFT